MPREPSNGMSVPVVRLLVVSAGRLLRLVPVAAAFALLLCLVRYHGFQVGFGVALLDGGPDDAGRFVTEAPFAVDLVVDVVALRADVLEVAAALLLRRWSDHADGRFFPLVVQEVAVRLAVQLAPLVPGSVAPRAADRGALLDHVEVAVRGAVIDAGPFSAFGHVGRL